MRAIARLRLPFLATICLLNGAILVLLAAPSGLGQDQSVLADIHKRLQTQGIEPRHDHDRTLFVAEIVGSGPVYQGVCKTAVSESVDFRVKSVLLGKPPQPLVHAEYVNCSRAPLPSPPFTLHSSVIVYCFQNMRALKCLDPVTSSEQRIQTVKRWIAQMPPEKGKGR